MAYSDKVIDHYENPRNVGKMDIDDTVGTGMSVDQARAVVDSNAKAAMKRRQ
jgi:NifU-like protein involved in Fe-S cluster formation